jgi:signal transduction histidine kinase
MMLKRGAKQVASGDFGYQIPIEGRDELADTAESFNSMSTALARFAEIAEDARRKAEQGRELAESTLKDALDSMRDHILVIDEGGKVLLANRSYRTLYCADTYPSRAEDAFAAEAARNDGETEDYVASRLRKLSAPLTEPRWEARLAAGQHLLIAQHPMLKGGVVVVQTDVSELYQALEENRQLQRELIQRQKSEAIGTLAGGLAHEINTPVQIIADNASFVAEAVGEIVQMVDGLSDGGEIADRLEAIDWTFVKDEIPQALADMADGTGRVRDLIKTFKQLAKPDGTAVSLVNLDAIVRSAIEDTRSAWTSVAEIRTDIPDNMPPVPCQVDQIRQVLRHLIVNAAHAIEDRGAGEPGIISIGLAQDQEQARIEVEDNGCGIPREHLDRIYDVLFTTKDPGRGSGQGLALSHMFVTRGHGGQIRVDSEMGRGTCFIINLPLACGRPADDSGALMQPLSTDEKTKIVA